MTKEDYERALKLDWIGQRDAEAAELAWRAVHGEMTFNEALMEAIAENVEGQFRIRFSELMSDWI